MFATRTTAIRFSTARIVLCAIMCTYMGGPSSPSLVMFTRKLAPCAAAVRAKPLLLTSKQMGTANWSKPPPLSARIANRTTSVPGTPTLE
ncbi:MAG: hypothetical protein AUI89_09365 [Gemmatimonadetes bacterium 13_1_40CM_3_65_8]|nr:MAG: hypothetical protein AUI89_09365 [Gemmatimonadetes bacterium 13_1_40CM_3_65_8]